MSRHLFRMVNHVLCMASVAVSSLQPLIDLVTFTSPD